jgi:regulator of protease activity HflC (stomatin/prohibitin superfamily)
VMLESEIWLVSLLIIALYLLSSIKVLREYERGVIFRLGRVLPMPKGPGLILVFAPIDRMVRISLRLEALEVPAQDVVTHDNVTLKVNAVIYFRVVDSKLAVLEVTNFLYATSQLAQTTLRSVLGEVDLDDVLSAREKLNLKLQTILDSHTAAWGVKVSLVEVKQVDCPTKWFVRSRGRPRQNARGERKSSTQKANSSRPSDSAWLPRCFSTSRWRSNCATCKRSSKSAPSRTQP